MRFRLSTALRVLLPALLFLVGACRPCAVVEDAWEARLVSELSEIGPGNTPDTGITDHLRLRLSRDAFATATGALAEMEVFRPVARASAVELGAGESVVAEGEMTGRMASVAIVAPDAMGRSARIEIDAVVAVHLDAIDRRGSYSTTAARAVVLAPLAFVEGPAGPQLVADLAGAAVGDVEFDLGPMPQGFADVPPGVVRELVEDMTAALLTALDGPVVLLEWPALELGAFSFDLTPSTLLLDPDSGSVTLGVVSALRPIGEMRPPQVGPSEAEFTYDVHPDLWRAALVHMQAVGRMPRRYELDGAAEVDGVVGVAVDAATVADRAVQLEFTTFCTHGHCRRDPGSASGGIGLAEGVVAVTLELERSAHDRVAAPVVEDCRRVLGSLATPGALALGTGAALVLQPSTLETTAGAVHETGTARVAVRPGR